MSYSGLLLAEADRQRLLRVPHMVRGPPQYAKACKDGGRLYQFRWRPRHCWRIVRSVSADDISALADSIERRGLLQSLMVRPLGDGQVPSLRRHRG